MNDLLVHLDGSEKDKPRTELALTLTKRFGSRLTGLFARTESSQINAQSRTESTAHAAKRAEAETAFMDTARAEGISPRFWSLQHGDSASITTETAQCARYFDIVVIGQRQDGDPIPADFIEQVVTQSGRPCLIAPATGSFKSIGSNVVVAWNAGREATRALHDSLPFIRNADKVEVVTIRKNLQAAVNEQFPAHITDHLSSYGVKVIREYLISEDVGVMDLLLSRAFDVGADLMVMGGHVNHTLPFFEGGGVRHVLKNMQVPLLISR